MTYGLTYSDGREWGKLTTEHAASNHNIPVLVVGGIAHGPADIVAGLPNEDIFGEATAASLVATWGTNQQDRTARTFADKFCSQWLDGPQVRGTVYRSDEP